MLKEATDAVIVYETNMEMNNKYDCKIFAKVAENIDLDKQIDFFKSKVNLLKVIFYPYTSRLMACQIFSSSKFQSEIKLNPNSWKKRKKTKCYRSRRN